MGRYEVEPPCVSVEVPLVDLAVHQAGTLSPSIRISGSVSPYSEKSGRENVSPSSPKHNFVSLFRNNCLVFSKNDFFQSTVYGTFATKYSKIKSAFEIENKSHKY